jgi:hypothetical protein
MPLSTSGSLLLSSINSEFFPNDNPINTYNWYNKMTYGTVNGYSPTVTGSDPTVQIQMSNSTAGAGGYIYQSNTPIQNANQFVFTWQMFINNTNSGDFINLYFGSNSANTTYGGVTSTNGMTFNFQLYPGGTGNTAGIYLYQNTTTIPSAGVNTNYVAKSTNTVWATNAWVNCMVVYQKGSQNTWNLYINGVNVISYNDPNNTGWLTQAGNFWGFQLYNGGAYFTSYLRQLNLSTNLPFAVVTPYNWYTNMTTVNWAYTYTPVSSGTDPNVQLQLSNGTSGANLQEAYVYNNFPVQNYGAFTLTFQFYLATSFTANGFYASFGHQSNVLNNFAAGLGNRYMIFFNTWAANPIGGTGIYLINNSQNAYTASNYLASAAITWTTNAWNTVTINYSRNSGGTWQVSYNGVNYISYSDLNNQRWITELAGNYWTIGSSSNTQTFYIRQVNMVVTPNSGGNSQKLVTPLNWYNKMSVINYNGTFTALSTGSDPNVAYQLSNAAQLEVGNNFYMQQRVQDYSSFTLQYDFKFIAGPGGNPWDGVYSYFGTTNNAAYNSSNNGFNIFNVLNTDVTGSQGSYLNTGSNNGWFGTTFGNISTPLVANSWYTTTINYTKGTTGTWKVDVNGNTILNISDPNNSSWVSTSSGNYWGIGGNSGGGATGSYFIRKVQLSYVPTTSNFSSLLSISNGTSSVTSLPPSAMSSNTLTISGNSNTLLNGTYTASASGSFNAPYQAFGSIPQIISQGWNSSSALYNTAYTSGSLYTGSNTTTVSSTSYSGEWIQLQVPNAVSINSFLICSQSSTYFNRSPSNFVLAGSNDASTWSALHIASGVNNWGLSNSQTFVCNQNNTNSYIYFRLIIQNVYKANAGSSPTVGFTLGTTFSATPQFFGICYSPALKMYTAVGIASNGAASNGAYSIDGGATWTLNGLSTALSYYGVTWAPALNMFIVPANGSATVYTSTNGTSWTSNTGGNANGWNAICWSSELNLAVIVCNSGTSGTGVQTSNNGSTWTVRTTPSANTWTGICWAPDINLFVAVGSSNTIMTSPDGFNWTTRSGPSGTSTNAWWGVCWSPYLHLFCSVSTANTTTSVMTSPDGITWTAQTNPTTTVWQSICWCTELKLFLACGAGGSSNRFMFSYDGISWGAAGSIVSPSYRAICWSSNDLKAVAVHSTGGTQAAAYTSPDGYASIGLLNLYTNSGSNVLYSQLRGKSGTSSGLNSNTLATDQGTYNSNTTYVSSFTTDTSARMIQLYGQTVNIVNTTNTRHLIQQTYTNTTNSTISATMTMSCQDFCKVYQNKVLIYPNFQVDAQMFTFQVILDIGVNLFEFVCWKNNNGLGGFIYTLINNSGGAVLMRSDNNSASALQNTSKITVTSTPSQLGPLDYIPSSYTVGGAYALVKLRANYSGVIVNVRRSSDNATSDFYADWQGNLATNGGGGASLANWLNGSTGYVTIWYDQSGNGNNATQSTTSLQPILTWNTSGNAWCVDTQNSSTQFLNIPSNTVPVGTQNQPYTFIIKHGSINNTGSGGFIGSGNGSTLTSNNIRCAVGNGNAYVNYWYSGSEDLLFGSTGQLVSGNTLAVTYNGYNKRYAYINNNLTVTWTQVNNYTNASGQQYLFKTAVNEYLNGQMYYCYIFKNNLGSYNGTGSSVNDIQETSSLTTLSNTLAYQLPLPNPCLNQVPVLDSISTSTKSGCRGAYALVRLSLSYTGATVNIRRGLDNATSDFYADIQGNLNTAINNTGTTLTNWLQGTIGYVAIWYDQSGNGNNATQPTNGLQPVITPYIRYLNDDVNWLVDSQSSGTQRLLIPSNTVPVGTLNAPYTFVFRHQAWNTTTGGILGAGIGSTNQANSIRAGSDGGVGYYNYWYNNDFTLGSNSQRVAGNQVVITYNGSTQTGYINTTQITSTTHTGGTTASGQQYLFSDAVGNYMNGQIYYFYIFGIAVPDIDRLKLMTI